MQADTISYVEFGGTDYRKVHRLREPSHGLTATQGSKTACGRTVRNLPYAAGWVTYDESRVWMCEQCRKAAR